MEHIPESMRAQEHNKELMSMPEFSVVQEDGVLLMSILLKMHDPSWGDQNHPLSKHVAQFIADNPTSDNTQERLAAVIKSVDEETLYHIALTFHHPKRMSSVTSFIARHKNHLPIHIENIYTEVISLLHDIQKTIPEHLCKSINEFTTHDITLRKENMDAVKKDFQQAIDYFAPRKNLSPISHITILPTDPLYPKESGSAFDFGDQGFLRYAIDNRDNRVHEFLHFIINPMIEKLSENLSDEQKESILKMSSQGLRVDQDYGDHYQSLLCEELIRTYTAYVMKNEKPLTYIDFSRTVDSLTTEKFAKILQEERKRPINRFATLDIESLDDMRTKKKGFFEYYVSSTLATNIATLYEIFSHQKNKRPADII